MKASILIPVFNREKTISRTLLSINKNKEISEIIVVDDCSTDQTEKVVEELKLDNLIYIKLKEKRNGNVARNLAAKAASGDVLIFLDSDDEFCEGRIDNLLSYYEKNNPELVVDAFVTEKKGKKTSFEFKNLNMDSRVLFEGLVCNAIPLTFSSISVKRDVFISMGFLDELTLRHQDRDFIFSAIVQGRRIHYRNTNDIVKHQSHDSFSRSGQGYMAALNKLADKYKIFSDRKFDEVRKYLIMRSLVGTLWRMQINIFLDNYSIYKNSISLRDNKGLRIKNYFLGKKYRKSCEDRVISQI
jgi:glycosyltransferase involved in cell wall biosynthesis